MTRKACVRALILICALTITGHGFAAGSQEAAGGPATLEMWLWKSFVAEQNDYMERQVRAYEAASGNKVNLTFLPAEEIYRKQLAAVEARTFPAVSEIWAQNIEQFFRMGVLADVSDAFGDLDRASRFSSLLGTMITFDGKKMGVPLNTSAEAHYWRKDILSGMGLQAPDTWDELLSVSKKITAAGDVYGFATPLGRPATDGEKFMRSVMWSYGASIADAKGDLAFKSPAAVLAFDYVAALYRDKIMPEGITAWDDGANNRAYQTKAVAGVQNTASIYNYLRNNDTELLQNTAIIPIPAGPKGRFTDTVPHALAVASQTRFPAAARELVKYVMELDRYQGWIEQAGGQIQPVYEALVTRPFWSDPNRSAFIQMGVQHGAYQGWPGPASAAAGEAFGTYVLSDTIQKVIIDGWTTARAIDWGNEKLQEIYERWKQ